MPPLQSGGARLEAGSWKPEAVSWKLQDLHLHHRYFRALQIGGASKVAPIDKLSLVLVAIFSFTFLGERPSAREWLGIGLVACGVISLGLKR